MFDRLKDILDPPLTKHRIFFFHIAKCGGTSIGQAIESAYKPWRNDGSRTVFRLDEDAARFAEEHARGTGTDVRRDLLNYALSLPTARCAIGHFHFSTPAFERYAETWRFVTVLRNPVERWLSHYSYNRDVSSRFGIKASPEEFVETEAAAAFGRAFIDEVTGDIEKGGLSLGKLTEIALARYDRFALVGCIEDTAGFARRFHEFFGHHLDIKRLNITQPTKRVTAEALGTDLLKRIERLCEPDLHVYERLLGKRGAGATTVRRLG